LTVGNLTTQALPENYDLYFEPDENALVISLGDLVPTRPPDSQPDSVRRAERAMRAAAAGVIPRRQPITVRRIGDRHFEIVDGNATFGVAERRGWTALPAKLEREA
jgi:hypothetical protein